MLHLQEQGRQALQVLLEAVHQRQKPYLDQLSETEMAEISNGLNRLEQFFHALASYLENEKGGHTQ